MIKKGNGATVIYWSDRKAGTIIEVSDNQKTVRVQLDYATRTDSHGMSDSQSYTYKRNKQGEIYTFTLRKNGRYVRQGDPMWGLSVSIGKRSSHYDFSF